MTSKTSTPDLSPRELAAVLAGLRLLREAPHVPADIHAILTDGDQLDPLNNRDIDQLCERLNTGPSVGGELPSDLHLYQRTYAGFVRIAAIVVGPESANAYMTEHPGTSLLALAPGEVALLADSADKGVPEDKVPAGPAPVAAVTVRHELTAEFIGDVLCTMIESGYPWIMWEFEERETVADDPVGWRYKAAVAVEIDEEDQTAAGEGDRQRIDAATIADAIGKILSGSLTNSTMRGYIAQAVAEQDASYIDADAADCIAQVAVFGELRYG